MLNETSAFLIRSMQGETDREMLLRRLAEEYEAPEEVPRANLDACLSQMREAGLLEEEQP